MDCRESIELMSGAVDNELSDDQAAEFFEHIGICGGCRDEYELERLTKSYIKRKIAMVEVPHDLQQSISRQFEVLGRDNYSNGLFSSLVNNSFFQPLLAFGLVALISVALFVLNKSNTLVQKRDSSPFTHPQLTNYDAISAAEKNFQDVLSGTLRPEVTSRGVADVVTFVRKKAGYSVNLPSIPNVDWVGASVTGDNNLPMAHVIYKMGDTYIYIFAFPKKYLDAKVVELPKVCIKSISDRNWYWTHDSNGDLQAVWAHDGNICVATANIEKKELASLLSTRGYNR